MKKSNLTRILVLVLSLALLIGSAMAITASAEETPAKGEFGGASVAYGEKVAIRIAVQATKEEIVNNDVIVSYEINGETKNATYKEDYEGGYVWVMTEGIAAYDFVETVTFSSKVGETTIESGCTYSVAQFLYSMLYTNPELETEWEDLYNALLVYGEAAQNALNINEDKLISKSTIVSTENANVTINGGKYVFAPGATLEVDPKWNGTLEDGMSVGGWKIINNGEEETVGLTFTCSGVVEIVEPIFHVHTHTPGEVVVENNVAPGCESEGSYDNVVYCTDPACGDEISRETITVDAIGHAYGDVVYEWAADNSTCTATKVCTNDASHVIEETATVSTVVLNVTATKVGYTYNVAFANAEFVAQSKVVEADAPTAVGRLVTVNAPAIASRTASHEYVKFDVEDEKADTFTIYYSEVDVWDGTSVSKSLSGSGTQEDPYLVQSGADLAYIAKVVNDAAAGTTNFKGMYFKMTKSIDLGGNSLKIGGYTAGTVFHGFFDGNNCVVKGINANQSLFGMLKDGYIKNLSTYGTVTTTEKKGVAGLVSYMNGATVENITNYVNVTGVQQVAGVVGWLENNTTTIANNCVNYGDIVATSYQIGGIAGFAKGTLTNCTNFGDVTSSGSGYVGGIGGAAKDAKGARTNCVNYGNVSATSYIGGCFGQITTTTTDCYSYGTVKLVSGSATTIGDVVGSGDSNLVYTAE